MDLPALETSLGAKITALAQCQDEADLKRALESVSKLVIRYEECLEEASLDSANLCLVSSHRKKLSQLLLSLQETQLKVRQSIRSRVASMERGQLLRNRVQQAALKSEAELSGEIGGTLDRLGQRLSEEIEKSSHNYALMGKERRLVSFR